MTQGGAPQAAGGEAEMRWRDGAGLRWLFLDLNSYFASVEQQLRPELRGRPVIVTPVASDYTSAIAASYEAKAFGVKTGTSVRDARRLCPGVCVVHARPDVYVDYHHRIVETVESFLHVDHIGSIDEMACALMGPERLAHNALALAQAVQAGILARVGECMGSSIGLGPSRLLAKTGSKLKKPRGITLVRADELPGRLLELRLTDLTGIAGNMERRLNAAGVMNVADFWALTPQGARAAWGSVVGEFFWRGLHGEDPPEVPTQRQSIGHSQVLATELRTLPLARLAARKLLAKAAARLRRYGLLAGAVAVGIRTADGARGGAETLLMATDDTLLLLRALEEGWHAAARDLGPRAVVKKVGVTLYRFQGSEARPADLFDSVDGADPAQPRDRRPLSRALDRLNRRFGRDAVMIGPPLPHLAPYTGGKIAFNRIPDQADFLE